MANVYSIAFAVVGTVIAHCCLLVWTALLLPRPVERARHRIESRPLASFLLGVLIFGLTAAAVAAFFLIRIQAVVWVSETLEFLSVHLRYTRFYNDAWIVTNLLIWLPTIPIFIFAIIGGAAFAQLFALRARALMMEDRPLVGLICGAFCTSAANLLPLIGWFAFLPIVGLMSIGSGLWGVASRSKPGAVEPLDGKSRLHEPALSHR